MSYKAFISYSHAVDNQLASRLQSALQRFAKPFYRLRHIRIFRDETTLSLTPELWTTIQKALSESEYFIFLASPRAAQSIWVPQEIEEWLKRQDNKLDKFMIVLTEGEIFWDNNLKDFDRNRTTSLPSILQGKFNQEPLYLDFRWAKTSTDLSLRNPEFLKGIGKIAAKLHSKELDEMVGEDIRQHRIFKSVAGAVIVILLFLLAATSSAAYYAYVQKGIAEEQRAYAEEQKKEADDQRDVAIEARNETKVALERETTAKKLAETKRKEAEEATKNEKIAKNQAEQKRKEAEIAAENERIAKVQAEDRRKEAERQTDKANNALRAIYTELGRQELINNNPSGAAVFLSEAYNIPVQNSAPSKISSLQYLLKQSMQTIESSQFSLGGRYIIERAAFSPDGKKLVTAGWQGNLTIHDLQTGRIIESFEHGEKVTSIEFSPDGKKFVTGGFDWTAKIWDSESGKMLKSLEHPETVRELKFSPDGTRIATLTLGGVYVWDTETGNSIATPANYKNFIPEKDENTTNNLKKDYSAYSRSVKFSPDNKKLIGTGGGVIALLQIENGKPLIPLKRMKNSRSIYFTSDGKTFLAVINGKTVQIEDYDTKEVLVSFQHPSNVQLASFSDDGTKLATICENNKVLVWDIKEEKILTSFQHQSEIESIHFAESGKKIITFFQFPDSGEKVITFRGGSRIQVDDIATKRTIFTLTFKDRPRFAVSPDGLRLLILIPDAINGNTLQIWDIESGNNILYLYDFTFYNYSSDGKKIITIGEGRMEPDESDSSITYSTKPVRIWNVVPETRPSALIKEIVEKKVRFQVKDGKLIPVD